MGAYSPTDGYAKLYRLTFGLNITMIQENGFWAFKKKLSPKFNENLVVPAGKYIQSDATFVCIEIR